MTTDPVSGVRLLGDSVAYTDGAERRLADVIEPAADRSSGSDELAAHITDWPSRYHLSRLRRNLLKPLRLTPGMRILDAGAGTGSHARYLGEAGVDVVALEGNLDRARVAAARCEGLTNIEVVAGSLEAFEDPEGFDLVLVVGVLEYTTRDRADPLAGPQAFLQRVRELCRPDGVVAVAIENQLGLKYLLGYAEDHVGVPWAGVEGYRGWPGVQTFSRRGLRDLLAGAGFKAQEWLYPFPDYKLPTKVLHERAYELSHAALFVDQLVGEPVKAYDHPPALLCDDRAAHEVFLDAGLGAEVANSFFVLAAGHHRALDNVLPSDTVAWHYGDERLDVWMRDREFCRRGDSLVVRRTGPPDRGVRERGWLRQSVPVDEPFVVGPTLERLAHGACRREDVGAVADVLKTWRAHIGGFEATADDTTDTTRHPFLPAGARRLLPPQLLDCNLDNFVLGEDGGLHLIDAEWHAVGGVDADLAVARSLWRFARKVVETGVHHPWPPSVTIDELTQSLGELCGHPVTEEVLARWRHAEAVLQAVVLGSDADANRERLTAAGRLSRAHIDVARRLPFTALRRENIRLHEELRELARRHQESAAEARAAADLRGQLEKMEHAAAERELLAVEAREQLQRLRGRRAVRIALRLARLARPLLGGPRERRDQAEA